MSSDQKHATIPPKPPNIIKNFASLFKTQPNMIQTSQNTLTDTKTTPQSMQDSSENLQNLPQPNQKPINPTQTTKTANKVVLNNDEPGCITFLKKHQVFPKNSTKL